MSEFEGWGDPAGAGAFGTRATGWIRPLPPAAHIVRDLARRSFPLGACTPKTGESGARLPSNLWAEARLGDTKHDKCAVSCPAVAPVREGSAQWKQTGVRANRMAI